MTDDDPTPPPVDLAGVLESIVQQQAALLQVHAESVRLQHMLVEELRSTRREQTAPAPAPEAVVTVTPAPVSDPVARTGASAVPAAVEHVAHQAPPPTPTNDPAAAPRPRGSRAALYYQQRPVRVGIPTTTTPRDLTLLRRLHEVPEASSLILQFGPYIGSTLAQVALHNPEYIRELVHRAQRPAVRAAAGKLVAALEAAVEHTATSAGRRKPSARAALRG